MSGNIRFVGPATEILRYWREATNFGVAQSAAANMFVASAVTKSNQTRSSLSKT